MRKPSRHMPTPEEAWGANIIGIHPVVSIVGFSAMAALAIGFLRVLWMEPVFTGIGILAFVLLIVVMSTIGTRGERAHYDRLSEGREDDSICDFARSFNRRHVDTWIIRAVYDHLQWYLEENDGREKFAIRADDHLFDDLQIDEEDFELELVPQIAYRSGRSLDNCEDNLFYRSVHTVGDLVAFFNSQPLSNTAQG